MNSNQKRFISAGIIFLIIAIIITTYCKTANFRQNQPTDKINENEAVSQPTDYDKDGRELKTYQNDILGFKFKYPFCEKCNIDETSIGISLGSIISVSIIDSDNLTLSNFVDKELDPEHREAPIKIENTVIDGEEAMSASILDAKIDYIKKGEKIYKISVGFGDTCCYDGKPYYEISAWDQIISTFEFTK